MRGGMERINSTRQYIRDGLRKAQKIQHIPLFHKKNEVFMCMVWWWSGDETQSLVDHGIESAHYNTLRPRQNGCHFADDIFKGIFLNENALMSIKISLTFVPKGPINNIPSLVQIMAWRRPGDKPLSEPVMVGLLTHICVTRPQWVKRTDTYNVTKTFERISKIFNAISTECINGVKEIYFRYHINKVR